MAVHRDLQPVVTTTGRGYASASGLRKPKDLHLDLSLESSIWLSARRLPFGFKPGGLAQPLPGSKAPVAGLFKPPQARRADPASAGVEGSGSRALQNARSPEGRYNLDLVARHNLATLGCVSPSGLAVPRELQPVVTTTGRGYASPPGLRTSKDFHLALDPKTSIWL